MPIEWLLYPLLGVAAGLLAGLLGIGGGLVLVAALVLVLPTQGVPASAVMHTTLATSLASVVITALASTRAHARRGSVLWPSVAWLAPGLLLGGWVGSLVATQLAGNSLRWFVVGYCVLAALQLFFEFPRSRPTHPTPPRGPAMTTAGLGIGAVSALVGIGGGSMTVPVLICYGVAPVRAVGTSAACGIVIALAASAGYAFNMQVEGMPTASLGYIYLPAALGISVTSALMAPLGASLAHRASPALLRRVFACFLIAMAALLSL